VQPADPLNLTDTAFVFLTLGTVVSLLFLLVVYIPARV